MFLRGRRLIRDRHAGLVFDWRKGHGSFTRQMIALILGVGICSALFAYVKIEKPETPGIIPGASQASPVTVVNLSLAENQWLARVVENASPFSGGWDVSDDQRLLEEIERAQGMVTPARYTPGFAEIEMIEKIPPLESLPGTEALPAPKSVSWPKVARKKARWWIEFEAEGRDWVDFAIPWNDQDGKFLINAGETWGFLVELDLTGTVLSCIELEGRGSPRSEFLSAALKTAPFPEDRKARETRWWKILATAVNRNATKEATLEANESGGGGR